MFDNLNLKNFRSFAIEQSIPIKPITLIYGANSSGKSSILKSILLMKQTLENASYDTNLVTKGQLADVGNFKDFINNQDITKDYSIKFGFDVTTFKEKNKFFRPFNFRYTRFKNLNKISIEYIYKNSGNKNNLLSNVNIFINDDSEPLLCLEKTTKKPNLKNGLRIRFNAIQSIKKTDQNNNLFEVKKINWESSYIKDFWKAFLDKTKKEKYEEQIIEKISHLEKKLKHKKSTNIKQRDIFGNPIDDIDKIISAYKKLLEFLKKDTGQMLETYKDALTSYYSKNFITFSNIIFLDESFVEEEHSDYFNALLFKPLNYRHYYYDDIDLTLDINHEFTSILYSVCNLVQSSLNSMKYLGALRDNPERYYLTNPTEKDYVGKSGKNTIDIIAKNKILKNKINKQLKVLDLGYSITPRKITNEDIYLFLLKEDLSGITVSLNDVGFGVSQILPILVQSMLSENETILIEQPEIHIHPRLQAELGSLFAECIKTPNNNKFIIETHSENIILRLQKLIRQKKLNHEDVSVIYVDKSEGGSICSRLRMDEKGYFIDKWPNGFFEESFEEIFD